VDWLPTVPLARLHGHLIALLLGLLLGCITRLIWYGLPRMARMMHLGWCSLNVISTTL
jgi:hypothetical protein